MSPRDLKRMIHPCGWFSAALFFGGIVPMTHPAAQCASLHLGDPPIEGQFTMYGASPGGGLAGLPLATGDFDGDGFLDLVATPMRARVSLSGVDRQDAGLAYVVFGDGAISGFVDMANPPPNSAVIFGARAGDHTGDEVWAGDVNGDQFDDILLCAQAESARHFGVKRKRIE